MQRLLENARMILACAFAVIYMMAQMLGVLVGAFKSLWFWLAAIPLGIVAWVFWPQIEARLAAIQARILDRNLP